MATKQDFNRANQEFEKKYSTYINNLASSGGGTGKMVDLSVGASMLKSNIEESLKGNEAKYKGGGVVDSDTWKQMQEDYKNLKNVAVASSSSSSSSSSRKSSGGNNVTSVTPSFKLPSMPGLRSADSMARMAGVNYDHDYIRDLMQDAVEKKYANLDVEFGRTQDIYYDAIANNSDMLRDTLRRGDRDAVMSGMGSGTQAATELAALLGTSQQGAQGATELAQGRSDLVSQRETELSQVARDALKYYNDLGINLMTLSNSELNALMTGYASQVATLGGVYNTDVLANVERERIGSSERIAELGNMTNKEIAEITGQYNLDSSKYAADKNLEAALLAAQRYSSGSSGYSSGGYSSGGYSSGGSGTSAEGPSAYEQAAIAAGLFEMTGDPAMLLKVAQEYGLPTKGISDLVREYNGGNKIEAKKGIEDWLSGFNKGSGTDYKPKDLPQIFKNPAENPNSINWKSYLGGLTTGVEQGGTFADWFQNLFDNNGPKK